MRYNIMLQLVTVITLILAGTAALFAWLQERNTSNASVVLVSHCSPQSEKSCRDLTEHS